MSTPFGSIRVYEWGPESGAKVLLLHGVSKPCPALGALAEHLANPAGHRGGCRVMLFDLCGRGYSDAPAGDGGGSGSGSSLPFDERLYVGQVLLVLASSRLAWTGDGAFHLVGYSLGGGLAVVVVRYFASMLRSVVVVGAGS